MTCREGHSAKFPDFEKGNVMSLVHGAQSPRTIQAKVDELEPAFVEYLEQHAPYAAAPAFELIRTNTLRSRALADLLVANILEVAEK